MPALVLPVVRGRMQDAEVGRGRRVEQLRDLVEGVGVRVGRARRVRVGLLVGERSEPGGRLVGERVGTGGLEDLPRARRPAPPERDPPLRAQGLVAVVAAGEDHVDDGFQFLAEEHLERGVDRGPIGLGDLVAATVGSGTGSGNRVSSHGR